MGRTVLGPAERAVTIYYDYKESLQWFLKTPIVEVEDQLGETRTKEIPSHVRYRGPSDTVGTNVIKHDAKYLYDPTLKSGNARPGKWFVLRTTDDADDQEKRRFTYVGSYHDLQSAIQADIKYPCYIRAEGSGRHTVNALIDPAAV